MKTSFEVPVASSRLRRSSATPASISPDTISEQPIMLSAYASTAVSPIATAAAADFLPQATPSALSRLSMRA